MASMASGGFAPLKDEGGTVAVLFAALIAVMCLACGAAIDVLRANSMKARLQAAVDSTVLSLAGDPELIGSEAQQAIFLSNYNWEGSKALAGAPKAEFKLEDDGTVSGQATVEMRTALLKLARFPAFKINVQAKAESVAQTAGSRLVFSASAVKGWFAKDIFIIERDAKGKITAETKVLSYDYDNLTDTRTVSPALGISTRMFFSGQANVTLRMRVWPDYPKQGSSRYTAKPVDYYSDDKNSRLRTGRSCTEGQLHEWEDAPNNAKPSEDDYKDFVYVMTCYSGEDGNEVAARLIE